LTRIFVSSIVSGYSILRTLMAFLQRTRISQRTTTTKERKEALRGGKSSQRNGTIHFLRTQDPKLHLQDGISTRSLKHGRRRRKLTSSTRRSGAEDCAFAAKRFAIVTDDEQWRCDPAYRLSCEKTGCYGCGKEGVCSATTAS
jgi:hypothetical protein